MMSLSYVLNISFFSMLFQLFKAPCLVEYINDQLTLQKTITNPIIKYFQFTIS